MVVGGTRQDIAKVETSVAFAAFVFSKVREREIRIGVESVEAERCAKLDLGCRDVVGFEERAPALEMSGPSGKASRRALERKENARGGRG